MSMRQDAIAIMRVHAGEPAEVVIRLIATTIPKIAAKDHPVTFARGMYYWIAEHGLAPGELRPGHIPFSLERRTPRDYADALKQLREHLVSRAADPGDVDQLMRDCSNFDAMGSAANGRTVSSANLKQFNKRVSEKAREFMDRCSSFQQWHEATTNEHSTPVNVMREWIRGRVHSIADEEIKEYFRDNPVCTVLIDPEDNLLRQLGYHTRGTKDVRYPAAGIRTMWLAVEPARWQWR